MNHPKKLLFIRRKAEEHVEGTNEKIMWSFHAVKKLRLEGLRKIQVEAALKEAILIEDYPEQGRPLPDCLILGFFEGDPIHVVVAIDNDSDRIIIVTVYQPDLGRWENDWKTRKR